MKVIETLSTDEERAAGLFRALGNPARMQIVMELARRNGCQTSTLTSVLPLAASTISEHLKVLKEAGVVRGSVEGDLNYCLEAGAFAWIRQFCGRVETELRSDPCC